MHTDSGPPILQQPKPPSHHLDPLSPPVPSRVASVAILMTGQVISLIGPARLVEHPLEEPAPLLIILWEPDLVGFFSYKLLTIVGAEWLSGRVLDSRPRGRGFEPHWRHCVVSLSKNINPT